MSWKISRINWVFLLVLCVSFNTWIQGWCAERPLGLLRLRPPMTTEEDLPLEENWNIICWSAPELLFQELEAVRKTSEAKSWCDEVQNLVHELSGTFPVSDEEAPSKRRVGNGKIIHAITHRDEKMIPLSEWDFQNETLSDLRKDLLKALTQKVSEGRKLQNHIYDLNASAALVRVNYTLQRRILLWNYCSALLLMSAPENTLPSREEWEEVVPAVERLVKAHPFEKTWISYFQLETLQKIHTLPPEKQREFAWLILERLHSPQLDASNRQFTSQQAFVQLEELLTRCASLRTAQDSLMRDVEEYESAENIRAGNRIIMEPKRLEMETGRPISVNLKSLELVYRNANMRLYVSREFLNSSLPQPEKEERTIQENMMNRTVYGRGVSNSKVRVQMVPDENQFHLGFMVEGSIQSSTYSPDVVTVYNQSDARFRAFKEVLFSTNGIQSRPAVADVQNNIQLKNLQTPLDPIPILGLVANGVARNQAEAKQADMSRMTENKIRNTVCSTLDEQVDAKLKPANEFLQEKFFRALNRMELSLEKVEAKTTENDASIRLRLAGEMHPGAFTPRPVPPEESLLNFQLHESSINNFLQQFKLEGRTFTVESLIAHIKTRLPNLKLGEKTQKPEEELFITFADENAATVHLENGRINMRIAVKKLQVGKRHWENFTVEVPYFVESGEMAIWIQREGPVRLIGRIPIGQQVAVRGIFSKIFQKTEEKNILPEKFTQNPRFEDLMLNQLVLQDGWLGISFGPKESKGLVMNSPNNPILPEFAVR